MRLADSDHPLITKLSTSPTTHKTWKRKNIDVSSDPLPAIAGAQGHYNIVYIMTDDHTAQ